MNVLLSFIAALYLAMALLLDFVEAFDEESGKFLKIGVETLLLFEISVFGAITLENQVKKWIVLAVHF